MASASASDRHDIFDGRRPSLLPYNLTGAPAVDATIAIMEPNPLPPVEAHALTGAFHGEM